MSNTEATTYDPSDRFDLDREWEVTPSADSYVPLAARYPDTCDVHPMDCRCLPCQAQAEYEDWVGSVVEAIEDDAWADLEAAWQAEAIREEQEGWY